jgi:rhodanese-related sulfurtransferase
MDTVPRISPEEIFPRVREGRALLVCAYPDEDKFRALKLAGAISYGEFLARLPGIPKDQEIVFYCA